MISYFSLSYSLKNMLILWNTDNDKFLSIICSIRSIDIWNMHLQIDKFCELTMKLEEHNMHTCLSPQIYFKWIVYMNKENFFFLFLSLFHSVSSWLWLKHCINLIVEKKALNFRFVFFTFSSSSSFFLLPFFFSLFNTTNKCYVCCSSSLLIVLILLEDQANEQETCVSSHLFLKNTI